MAKVEANHQDTKADGNHLDTKAVKNHLDTKVDETYQELNKHGTKELPIETYEGNCEIFKAVYSHWHKEMELIYIREGCGLCQLNKEVLKIQEGDILLINSGMLHHLKSDRRKILHFVSVVFDLSYLSGMPGDLCQEKIIDQLMDNQAQFIHIIHPEDKGYTDILYLLFQIYNCHRKKEDYFYVRLKGLFYQLFYQMLSLNYIIPANPQERRNLSSIKDVLRYMNEHYKEPLNASELAAMSNYNESYFMKLFKQYTGKTLVKYMTELRLEKAHHLLKHSSLSITEIALETGFNGTSYFIKKFQEAYGMSPQKFRRTIA